MPGEIILENESLIYSVSKNFYGVEREDLIQAGFLGLMKAYRKYDATKSNAKFSTYAYGFVYGEMYETANGNRPIRVRKPELKLYKGVVKAKELLEAKYERSITYEEACAFLHVDYQTFTSILNALSAKVSIDDIDPESRGNNIDDMILLRESLQTLSPLEKSVIERRYVDDLSQQEAAKVLGLSQVKVSRVEKTSREKLKNFVNS